MFYRLLLIMLLTPSAVLSTQPCEKDQLVLEHWVFMPICKAKVCHLSQPLLSHSTCVCSSTSEQSLMQQIESWEKKEVKHLMHTEQDYVVVTLWQSHQMLLLQSLWETPPLQSNLGELMPTVRIRLVVLF